MGPSLLLVDDDKSNRLVLSVVLEDAGYRVEVAGSFAAASERLADDRAHYDVVLFDRFLGDGDGARLLPIVRARFPEAHAVLLSGAVDASEVKHVGFDAAVVKGARLEEVLSILERLVHSNRSQSL
jgi:CheY-like chemotaxis protein